MAATFAQVGDLPYYVEGARKRSVTDMTFDSSYLTGGEAFANTDLRLNRIEHVEAQIVTPGNATGEVGLAKVDLTNGSGGFVELWDDTPAEITSADDVSACVVRLTARGT